MKILSVKNNKFNCTFQVELDQKKWKQEFANTKKNLAKNISIPGFRKGHIPASVIDDRYSPDQIAFNALQSRKLTNDIVTKIIEQKEFQDSDCLDSVCNMNIVKINSEKDAPILEITFDLIPQVENFEPADLKNISVLPLKTREFTDEMAKNQIKMMIKKDAMISEKEDKTVAKGNIAVIDFKGFIDNKAFLGGESKNFQLEIGSKSFIDNFEDQLIGCKKGDKKEVNVTFPADYHAKFLAGKKAKFEVTINDVKEIEYPELNKEYLSKYGTEATNEKELITWLKKLVKEEDEFKHQQEAIKNINLAITQKAKLNYYPKSLLEMHKKQILSQYEQEAKNVNCKTLAQYKKKLGLNNEAFEQLLENAAKSTLAVAMVYDKLIEHFKLKVTPEDEKDYLSKLTRYLGDAKRAKEMYEQRKDMAESNIIREKLFKKMLEEAKKEEPKAPAKKAK